MRTCKPDLIIACIIVFGKITMPQKAYLIIFITLSVAGVALIGWGTAVESNNFYSLLLTSIGGALVGANISLLIGSLRDDDSLNQTKNILIESLLPGFTSKEEDIKTYRKQYHRYHMTEMEKGKFIWRHGIIDFSCSQAIGKLSSVTHHIDKKKNPQPYKVEAGSRDERLIIFAKAEGREPTTIEIYPLIGKQYKTINCGLTFLESYSGNQLLSPCIISEYQIGKYNAKGTVDEESSKELTKTWADNFPEYNEILPIIRS